MGNQQPNLEIRWYTNYEREPVIPSIENYTANRPPEPPHPEWIKSYIAPMPKVPESLDESVSAHPVKKPKLTANEQEHPRIPGPMKKPRLECTE